MGMGWNLFRKQIVTGVLLYIVSFSLPAGQFHPTRSEHLPPIPLQSEEKTQIRHISQKLWSRTLPENPLINKYIKYFSQGEGLSYLERCLKRSEPFLPFIAQKLEEKGMPPELIYLPVIESAFRVDAVSRSGATGLWQFMLNSISPYDINVDVWRDDRRDFWKSTEAALEKLKYNYSVTGDWTLALAAYNCGLNKIKRTIASSGVTDYWELSKKGLLPAETRNYIPKLAAVAYLCNSKGANALPLLWKSNIQWERIPIKKSVDIRRIAIKTGVDENLLMIAHSELNYAVTPPASSGYEIKVPVAYSQKIREILNKESNLLEFKRYSIQTGDTLSELAQWYRIPIDMIKEYNPGVSSRYLRIGQVLLIPLIHSGIPDRVGIVKTEMASDWTDQYTVQAGDSLWKISRRYQISPEMLAAGNLMSLSAVIMPGMVLKVPSFESRIRE